MIIYKLSSQNRADPLTRRDQEIDSQMAIKISTRIQTLLRPENLDPRIIIDLNLNPVINITPINPAKGSHNLINNLLQANQTSIDLETLRQRAIDENSG
jgi:hypothetical protein